MEKVYDYIVIGSGFGGSVSAMRLAEKGYSVLVLEKGKKYENSDFPNTNKNIPKYFWLPKLKCFGILKLTLFKEAFILSGVGVGGGSLVYANTHLIPKDAYFTNSAWAKFNDWKRALLPFYEKARFMLGTTRNQVYSLADDILKEVAKDMGREKHVEGVDVGVYFGDEDKKTDPYFKGLGPLRNGCKNCGGCMVGCRYNAKNTLDKNYLFFAQQFGAKIEAEHQVEKIEYNSNTKEYYVHTQSSTSWFNKKRKKYTAKGIIVAGGVLGTLELLFKQKYRYQTLPKLSEHLGNNLRTNSEMLCAVTSDRKLNHGIAISSGFSPDDNTHVEIVKYPDGSGLMKVFATIAAKPSKIVPRFLVLLKNIIKNPGKFFSLLFTKDWAKNTVIFLVMQNIDSAMKMRYKNGLFSRLVIENNQANKVPSYIEIGQEVMDRYAEKVNGVSQNAVTEILFDIASTAHILGGCPMGTSSVEGVVNEKFEVFGYPNMHILDGSIVQGNLGVNPSLTITALSEYAMSLIPLKAGYTKESLDEQLKQKTENATQLCK